MAGSYRHIVDSDGNLVPNEEFIEHIENLGDAYEAIEECWYLINILSSGDKKKIEKATELMYQIMGHRYR